ncbi:unnamed protein product [Cuscuta europaea]|uniref:Uncharacterized protein n=1 Tax=Cuscuta europaea TaxID=41803 RepID=A0A9P1EHL4_CUSEU|nr:unnamed protein product [Cuscuta europaea]
MKLNVITSKYNSIQNQKETKCVDINKRQIPSIFSLTQKHQMKPPPSIFYFRSNIRAQDLPPPDPSCRHTHPPSPPYYYALVATPSRISPLSSSSLFVLCVIGTDSDEPIDYRDVECWRRWVQ